MTHLDSSMVLERLSQYGSEAAHVHHFSLWLEGNEVTIEISDHGADAGALRYAAHAYLKEIPASQREVNSRGLTIGNPGSTPEEALDNLHWEIFQGAN